MTPEGWSSVMPDVVRDLEKAFPLEAAGALFTNEHSGPRVRPVRLAHATRGGFRFDDHDWLNACLEADARNETLCCLYHSHVGAAPLLSEEDKAAFAPQGQPLFPSASILIVSIDAGRASQAALFRWARGEFYREPLTSGGQALL
jgi:proteasome lid subunit RPN8/RPN11